MRQLHLKALRTPRQFHTYKGNVGKVAPNTLDRNFRSKEPNKKWTTDVTQVMIKDERMYLSPILDMFNGEIITYTVTSRPDLKMVIDMVNNAMKKVPNHEGLILHSDQGWHYQHVKYQDTLKKNGIEQSMSRKGNCLDNAMMENFFGIMKTELLYSRQWNSMDEFKKELRKYIHYYNHEPFLLCSQGSGPPGRQPQEEPRSLCSLRPLPLPVSGGGHVLQRLLPSRHLRLSDIPKKNSYSFDNQRNSYCFCQSFCLYLYCDQINKH